MKSLLVYYSHSGNTAYVTDRFRDALKVLGHADIFELEYWNGKPPNIIVRYFGQFFTFLIKIKPIPVDLKEYNILFLGIPVITNRPSAPIIKYMGFLKHLSGKKIICCYVYGMESHAKQCAKFTDIFLSGKGNHQITHVYASYNDIYNEEFLSKLISDTVSRIK